MEGWWKDQGDLTIVKSPWERRLLVQVLKSGSGALPCPAFFVNSPEVSALEGPHFASDDSDGIKAGLTLGGHTGRGHRRLGCRGICNWMCDSL